jgi:hypothetical protein
MKGTCEGAPHLIFPSDVLRFSFQACRINYLKILWPNDEPNDELP